MAESTKMRLVRCPKCENLLPELANYSVYQCGGCGAVLRAKNKNKDSDSLSEKSDEEKVAGVASKLQDSLDKGVVELSEASDMDVKSSTGSLRSEDKNVERNDISFTDRHRNVSKVTDPKWVVENGLDATVDRGDCENAVAGENGDLNSQNECTIGSWRSGQTSGWDKDETEALRKMMRTAGEGVRFSTSKYPDEGPSNYTLNSSYSYREPMTNQNDQDGVKRFQYLENDRAELLKKLDELKEQLCRSCDVTEKPKEKVLPQNGRMDHSDPYVGSSTWFPASSSASDRASKQFFTPDKHSAAPPYFSHHPESFPYNNRHEMPMHSFHPSMQKSQHIPGYGDPFGSQIPRRAPHQVTGQYPQPSRQYFSGHYFDSSPPDPFDSYSSNPTFHHPSCSCFHCYEKQHGVPEPVLSSAFGNKRFPDYNPILHHHENLGTFGSHLPNSRATIPPNFHAPQSHMRWPSDLNADMGGLFRRPRRVVLASGGRSCRPIAGGAPFFTCFNCFELLQLPKKTMLMAKNQHKMRCGSCSAVISFAVANKKLVLSANTEPSRILAAMDDSSNEIIKGNTTYSHSHISRINVNFSSDDYDNSDYDFQTVDTVASPGQGLNSSKPQEMHNFHSTSPSTSEDENSPDVLIAQREVINSVQQPIKGVLSPPPPGSPLQQHFDYSSNNHVVNRFGKGNRSSRTDQEKVITNKATARQNSMKEASLPTEMEMSFHEYNTGVSQDSADTSREDTQPKTQKGGESFLANIIKKSFKDLSRSNQTDGHGKSNVIVNGHFIPERVVKKAEKLAGPIHPGQYWYDFRAGFWGAMGGPCLGIIPPFIEEFNYGMPEDCAGGNTGIFVNGRELHQKDLDLLASRGLPTERERSYIVEINGRVLDEDTGEEMDGLGKLAPTVERVKHGFGMKAPKAAAQ